MKVEIERAEKEADVTVIMPQMGVEYRLEPTDEQVKLYHKMIDWGADIIFGAILMWLSRLKWLKGWTVKTHYLLNGEFYL